MRKDHLSLDIDNDNIIAGTYCIYPFPPHGDCYIFNRSGSGNWQYNQKLTTPNGKSLKYTGPAVSIDKDYAVIGAPIESLDEFSMDSLFFAGGAYVFKKDVNNVWHLVRKLVASDRSRTDQFGTAVSISNNYIIAGAEWECHDENGMDSISATGSAYIFKSCANMDVSVSVNDSILTSNAMACSYQWLDCNNNFLPISGATNQQYIPLISGNYAVEITDGFCVDTSSCYSTTGIGIMENETELPFIIYPNPSQRKFTINLCKTFKELQLIVRNAHGQVVLNENYKATNMLIFDVEGADGIYFVTIHADNKTYTLKIIKM